MLRETRHRHILKTLAAEPASVAALSSELGVSRATIRRDLTELSESGQLKRVHGGAVATETEIDQPFDEVAAVNPAAKQAIAERAAKMIEDGETIILDIGTTCERVAWLLRGRPVTVVTSSLPVADALIGDPVCEVLLLGGLLQHNYRATVGFLTEESLRQIRADKVFLGASGVSIRGDITDTTVTQIAVKRAMMNSANRRILLVDADKFPGSSGGRVCGLEALDVIITTGQPVADFAVNCREADVELVTV